jgi:hypothetical protein
LLGVGEFDHQPVRHVQQPEVTGNLHVADHRAADQRDVPSGRLGGVEHLLYAVYMRGEAGDDDPAARLADHVGDHHTDVALARDETGHLGVGRVGEEEVDTLGTDP